MFESLPLLGMGSGSVSGGVRGSSQLLYVHAAGYGVEGPHTHRPIYAGVTSALVGAVERHSGSWLDPELTKSLRTSLEAQPLVLPPMKSSKTPCRTAPGCKIGEQSRPILVGLGYDGTANDAFIDAGVVPTSS